MYVGKCIGTVVVVLVLEFMWWYMCVQKIMHDCICMYQVTVVLLCVC